MEEGRHGDFVRGGPGLGQMSDGLGAEEPLSNRGTLHAFLALAMGFLASCLFPNLFAASQDTSHDHVLRVDTQLVLLPVTVTNHEGHFISGLDVSNFRVCENGRPQKIEVFRNFDVPVTVGLVVDHSGSMSSKMSQVIQGALAFAQASNPEDREFVVNFSDTVSFGLAANMAFTSNTNDLRAALLATLPSGRTALYDSLKVTLEHLQTDPSGKKVILLISDGGDNASRHNFAQVLRIAQSTNVIIYAIGLLDEYDADQNPQVLKKLARETGGEAYFPNFTKEITDTCRQIAADIRHQYMLGYVPPNSGQSGYRRIRVSISAPGKGKLIVRTRSGYFLPANHSS
jgi:Ca-activated chloride channel family protein